MNKFESLSKPERPNSIDHIKFSEYFHNQSIESVEDTQLPIATKWMEQKGYRREQINEAFRVLHKNGDESYISVLEPIDEGQDIFVADYRNNKLIGWGIIEKWDDPKTDYYSDKPYVGYTYTSEENRGQGLGTRRYWLMNAVTQARYNEPLRSDYIRSDIKYGPDEIWEKMVQRNEAVREDKESKGGRLFRQYVMRPDVKWGSHKE